MTKFFFLSDKSGWIPLSNNKKREFWVTNYICCTIDEKVFTELFNISDFSLVTHCCVTQKAYLLVLPTPSVFPGLLCSRGKPSRGNPPVTLRKHQSKQTVAPWASAALDPVSRLPFYRLLTVGVMLWVKGSVEWQKIHFSLQKGNWSHCSWTSVKMRLFSKEDS